MNKKQLVKILKKEFLDNQGNIDLSDLDFEGFEGNFNISGIKNLNGAIFQCDHQNHGYIMQEDHQNDGDIFQRGHGNKGVTYRSGRNNE